MYAHNQTQSVEQELSNVSLCPKMEALVKLVRNSTKFSACKVRFASPVWHYSTHRATRTLLVRMTSLYGLCTYCTRLKGTPKPIQSSSWHKVGDTLVWITVHCTAHVSHTIGNLEMLAHLSCMTFLLWEEIHARQDIQTSLSQSEGTI